MIKVSIIGSGNVAQHLISAFTAAPETELVQVFARNSARLSHLISDELITSDFAKMQDADLYIIAVSDDAISLISNQLPFKNKLVAHTSGSVAISAMNDKNRRGSFYPLQTFSINKSVDFAQIPVCLESENAADFQLLDIAAKAIAGKTFAINSQQRKAIHVAAVFVNNFVNHLYLVGEDICKEYQVPFEILKPLILETAEKVMTLSPQQAQTGPAKRSDQHTISAHLELLNDHANKDIYQVMTQSIQAHE